MYILQICHAGWDRGGRTLRQLCDDAFGNEYAPLKNTPHSVKKARLRAFSFSFSATKARQRRAGVNKNATPLRRVTFF
ncbi:hypothetical protein SNN74_000100 [Cronobacter turicensis]|uniref:hypothetical protein n=1 Tax=Cronobacter turicensis TaxID=413502 RepID=UPI0024C40364|nr:hypothetical protein [Cronobacter turicensis]ELY5847430.1 hypothetical protein [Cronobacter turicensis]MDK1334121.1 hypothetical protein [Cronobacter turicensis]